MATCSNLEYEPVMLSDNSELIKVPVLARDVNTKKREEDDILSPLSFPTAEGEHDIFSNDNIKDHHELDELVKMYQNYPSGMFLEIYWYSTAPVRVT
jgi:hypothetical protein